MGSWPIPSNPCFSSIEHPADIFMMQSASFSTFTLCALPSKQLKKCKIE